MRVQSFQDSFGKTGKQVQSVLVGSLGDDSSSSRRSHGSPLEGMGGGAPLSAGGLRPGHRLRNPAWLARTSTFLQPAATSWSPVRQQTFSTFLKLSPNLL